MGRIGVHLCSLISEQSWQDRQRRLADTQTMEFEF